MATALIDIDTPIYPLQECKRFIQECLEAAGASKENADQHADLLVSADYRGHYSHGMNRLEMYTTKLMNGSIDGEARPIILKEGPCTAWVDGCNGLGAVVGNYCMHIAIKKAKAVGVGWVCAKRCTHYGIAGWYTLQALDEGLIGFSCTNTKPAMIPTRGHKAALGTNPISFAAPGTNNDSFVLDMATTVVSLGKIEMNSRNGKPIPEGWAQDSEGTMITDPDEALKAELLLPVGGTEISGGYKGYGMGLMVDVMSGVLSGANYSVRDVETNIGQCFYALDPNCFAPDFETRMTDIMEIMRNMEPEDPEKPILVHGDTERMHMKAVDIAGGVKFAPNQLETCHSLSKQFDVLPLRCKCIL